MMMQYTNKRLTLMLGLSLYFAQVQAGEAVLSDPTRPWQSSGYQQQRPQTAASYTLNATVVSSTRRVAVINGQHVSEGETVGNAIVVRIGKYDVLLESPDRQIKLKLMPDIVKK